MSRRGRIARSTRRFKQSRMPDVKDIESIFPNPPHLGALPTEREVPVTDTTEELPPPPPDDDEAEETTEAHPPTDPDGPVPWRERERRRVKPDWLDDPWGNVCWWLGYAANVCAFHAIRAPWYLLLCLGRTPRGIWRLYSDLRRFGRPESDVVAMEIALNERRVDQYIVARHTVERRTMAAVAAGFLIPAAVAAVLIALDPGPRIVAAVVAAIAVGLYGRPLDRPAFPSAVIAAPKYRKITPDMIIQALAHAGLCKANEDPKDMFHFEPPGVHRDGDGWAAVVILPPGVTADQAIARHTKIAAGLRVDEGRLFLSRVRGDRGHAGLLDVYIANRDPFGTEPVPSELTKARSWSLWKPVPFGKTARGKRISFLLVWTGVLIGAMPRQGKSFAARLLAAAAALDANARLIVFNGKHGKDWSAFQEVAHRYGAGVRDHVVESLVQTLRESLEDMNRRYELLDTLSDEECPEGKVTPELCERRDLDLPLTVIIIDEVQEYLDHEEHGKLIKALLTKLAKLAPAVGYMIVLSTQKPDGDTIPTALRDQLAARFCLKTANRDASKTVLGKIGDADPRPEDIDADHKGTGVLLGADVDGLAGHGSMLVRADYMDLVGLRKVCKRGRELREVQGTLTGYAAGDLPEEPVPNMLLEHVHSAMDSTEAWVWSSVLCDRLAEAQPDLYDGWTADDLGSALSKHGVTTVYKGGKGPEGNRVTWKAVLRQDVIDALARRAGAVPDSPAEGGL